mgnify:CR=1 FL=1
MARSNLNDLLAFVTVARETYDKAEIPLADVFLCTAVPRLPSAATRGFDLLGKVQPPDSEFLA